MLGTATRTVLLRARNGEYRWETYAANNRTIGGSTETFKNKADCIRNAQMNGIYSLDDRTI